ncbi:MAG: hypothetical protein K8T89_10215 [Planctomycetes bacterium]|nr:hypothetical protein [Planctomycetota bacterium]
MTRNALALACAALTLLVPAARAAEGDIPTDKYEQALKDTLDHFKLMGISSDPPAKLVRSLQNSGGTSGNRSAIVDHPEVKLQWDRGVTAKSFGEKSYLGGKLEIRLDVCNGDARPSELWSREMNKAANPDKGVTWREVDINGSKGRLESGAAAGEGIRMTDAGLEFYSDLHVQNIVWRRGNTFVRVHSTWNGKCPEGARDALLKAVDVRLLDVAKYLDSKLPKTEPPSRFRLPTIGASKPITEKHVDMLLDFYAAQLKALAKVPHDDGGYIVAIDSPQNETISSAQAADLARAIWDQLVSLMRLANHGTVPVNDVQKKRIRVLGHWIAYVVRKSWESWLLPEDRARLAPKDEPDGPFGEPKWPLFGAPQGEVPVPPIRNIVDRSEDYIINEAWTRAFANTILRMADVFWTKGLCWAVYVAVENKEVGPLATLVVCGIPYAGPFFAATLVSYHEIAHFGEYALEDHIANFATLFNLGAAAYLRLNPKPHEMGDPAKGIYEGGVPKPVKEALAGNASFKILRRWEAEGQMLAEIQYALAGPLKGIQDGKFGTPSVVKSREVRVVEAAGKTRFFDRQTGEPIIPHGEEGYHAWSHLTELKCGHDTGLPSLRKAFKGTTYEQEVEALAKAFCDEKADLPALNRQYIEMVNRFVNDYKANGKSAYLTNMETGYFHFPEFFKEIKAAYAKYKEGKAPDAGDWLEELTKSKYTENFYQSLEKMILDKPEANYYLTVKNGEGQVHIVRVAVDTNGETKNVFVMAPEPIGKNLSKMWYNHWSPKKPLLRQSFLKDYIPEEYWGLLGQ